MGLLDFINGRKAITAAQYHEAAVVIRMLAVKTARELNVGGNENQFMFTLTDLIGYFAAAALIVSGLHERTVSREGKLLLFAKLRTGFRIDAGGPESDDPSTLRRQISQWVDSPDFEQMCSGYLAGDFATLGITPIELGHAKDRFGVKNIDTVEDRRNVALILRCSRYLNAGNTLPTDPVIFGFYVEALSSVAERGLKIVAKVLTGKSVQ
jgi:hypothetical protein